MKNRLMRAAARQSVLASVDQRSFGSTGIGTDGQEDRICLTAVSFKSRPTVSGEAQRVAGPMFFAWSGLCCCFRLEKRLVTATAEQTVAGSNPVTDVFFNFFQIWSGKRVSVSPDSGLPRL